MCVIALYYDRCDTTSSELEEINGVKITLACNNSYETIGVFVTLLGVKCVLIYLCNYGYILVMNTVVVNFTNFTVINVNVYILKKCAVKVIHSF